MPTIPTYQKQVEEIALPGARQQSIASPDLFAGPNNLGKAGLAIADAAQQYQDREDTASVNQGEAGLLSAFTKIKTDAAARKGLNASGLVEESDKLFSDTVEEAVKNAPNARVGGVLRAIALKHLPGFQGYIAAHAAEQTQLAVDEESKANIAAQIDSAIVDPRSAPDAANRVAAIVQSRGAAAGHGEETIKLDVQKELTALHAGVVDQLIQNGKVDDAKAYFYGNKASIDPNKYVNFEQRLALGGRVETAQKGADTLMDQVRAGAMTYDQAEAAARGKFSGEDRNAVIQELRSQKGEFDHAHAEAEKAQFAPVNSLLGDYTLNGKAIPRTEMQRVLRPLMSSPDAYAKAANLLDQHNDEIRNEQNAAADRARALANNGVEKQYYGLQIKYDMLQYPDKWRNADLGSVLLPQVKAGVLRPADVDEAIKLQQDMRKPEKAPHIASLTSSAQYLEDRLNETTINGTKFSAMSKEDQDAAKTKARALIDPLLTRYVNGKGKDASEAEMKAVIDSAFISKTFRKTIDPFGLVAYGDVIQEKSLDTAGAEKKVDTLATLARIPPGMKTEIINLLRKNQEAVTNENIVEAYRLRSQQ